MSSSETDGRDDDGRIVPVAPEEATDVAPAEAAAAQPSDATGLTPATTDEIETLRRERKDLEEALLRRRAEFENYRRRVDRETKAAAHEAAADVLRRLVDTVDNLERALDAQGGETPLRAGLELTLRDLRTTFDALGVTAIDPLGQAFDPAYHQALLHEPVAGVEAGSVAEVFRKGYSYEGRLLRPALVKVSSGSEAAAAGGGEGVH